MKNIKNPPPIYCVPIATGNFKDNKTEYQCSSCGKIWWSPNKPENNFLYCPKRVEEYASQFTKLSLIEKILYIYKKINKKIYNLFLMYNPMAILRLYTRINVCNKCPFYVNHLHQCRMCGCNMTVQARDINWKCPLGKWPGESEPKPIKDLLIKYNINKDLKVLSPNDLKHLKENEQFEDDIKSEIYKYIHSGKKPSLKPKGCNHCGKKKKT